MRFLQFLLGCFFSLSVAAQQPSNRTDLERQRQQIMETIKITQQQLELTKKDTRASVGELRALQNRLAERQKLISNINQEIAHINQNINKSASEIQELRGNLDLLKVKYAQSIRYSYMHRSSYNMLAYLFSSNDFNDAIRRVKYLKKYRDYRKDQAEQIRLTQSKIEKKIDILNSEKSQKDQLKSTEEQQKSIIQQETVEKDKVVKELKGREKELAADIEKNRKAANKVDVAINKIIQREIELARKKAEEEERKRKEEEQKKALAAAASNNSGMNVATGSGIKSTSPGTTTAAVANNETKPASSPALAMNVAKPDPPKPTAATSYINTLTPEVASLSNNFELNRGKLPWPVDKGFISLGFGKYTHPTEGKVQLENFGIDISTNPGTQARAIFEGSVTKSFFVPGRNWNVIINHGAYFTVYSGLSTVSVKADQKVDTKQLIGTVGPNDEGITVLNFQIWKVGKNNQSSKLDPAQWIAR